MHARRGLHRKNIENFIQSGNVDNIGKPNDSITRFLREQDTSI